MSNLNKFEHVFVGGGAGLSPLNQDLVQGRGRALHGGIKEKIAFAFAFVLV